MIFLLALCIGYSFAFAETIKIGRLTCENTEYPMCVDAAAPLFGWQCTSDIWGDWQTVYLMMVSDNKEDRETDKGNVWNSGLIKSDRSDNIVYKKKKLHSATRYYWKVCIWNSKGESSAWSEIACFETGLLNEKDWKALWVGDDFASPAKEDFYEDDPAPVLRKTCRVEKAIVPAKLCITGLGYYEVPINGRRVSDRVLVPGWTDYKQTVLYDGYDVTEWIAKGKTATLNAVRMTEAHPGVFVYDFGQNFVEMVRLNVNAFHGTAIFVTS